MPVEVVRSQGDHAGASPSARSAQRRGGCTVQNRPDSHHRGVVGHGASTAIRPAFVKWGDPQIDMFATFTNRCLIKFVSPYPPGGGGGGGGGGGVQKHVTTNPQIYTRVETLWAILVSKEHLKEAAEMMSRSRIDIYAIWPASLMGCQH